MKILYVTTVSDTVNSFLIPHIKFLIKQGNQVGVAFNIVEEVNPEITQLGCKIHQIDFQRNPLKKANIAAYKKIQKIITLEKYELVHVHTPVASFFTRFACRNIKMVKVMYTAHGFHFFKGAPKKNWAIYYTLEKIAAKWTDGIITMNDEDYYLARKFKLRMENRIYKIHGIGLDLKKFTHQTEENKLQLRTEYGYHTDDFILIYVGELSYRKNQEMLIKAVDIVKDEIPNLKLLLVGNGDLDVEYQELASRLGIRDKVDFLGYRQDIPQLMRLADLAVSTSRQEGLPVNVMEAMSTGLPLIVTNCRGNRDLVIHHQNGIVIGLNDVEGYATAIKRLYESEELRLTFSQENKKIIQSYSLENVIRDMGEIYSKQMKSS